MSKFNKDELALWKNTLADIQQQISEWVDQGECAPPWMYLEEGRTKGMINVLEKEAKKSGWTEEDLIDLEYTLIGGK